jgi:hypothetical protein
MVRPATVGDLTGGPMGAVSQTRCAAVRFPSSAPYVPRGSPARTQACCPPHPSCPCRPHPCLGCGRYRVTSSMRSYESTRHRGHVGGGPTSRSDAGQRMPSIRRTDRRCALTHGPRVGLASLSKVSVPVVRAAVLSAYNLAGSARRKDWGVVHILEVGALTVDFLLTGLANLGDGNGCAHHCEYRKPSANRGQKCSDGSRCWARITTLYAAREPHITG